MKERTGEQYYDEERGWVALYAPAGTGEGIVVFHGYEKWAADLAMNNWEQRHCRIGRITLKEQA